MDQPNAVLKLNDRESFNGGWDEWAAEGDGGGEGRQEYTNRLLWGLGNKSLGEEELELRVGGVKR